MKRRDPATSWPPRTGDQLVVGSEIKQLRRISASILARLDPADRSSPTSDVSSQPARRTCRPVAHQRTSIRAFADLLCETDACAVKPCPYRFQRGDGPKTLSGDRARSWIERLEPSPPQGHRRTRQRLEGTISIKEDQNEASRETIAAPEGPTQLSLLPSCSACSASWRASGRPVRPRHQLCSSWRSSPASAALSSATPPANSGSPTSPVKAPREGRGRRAVGPQGAAGSSESTPGFNVNPLYRYPTNRVAAIFDDLAEVIVVLPELEQAGFD